MSAIQRLLAGAVLNAKVRLAAIPTLPFVTTSVSTTLEHEVGDDTDYVAGPNLHTIRAPQRFVISSDSSHHSGANVVEAEVDSVASLLFPIIYLLSLILELLAKCLSAEVRMRAEYNVKERRRLKSIVEKHDELMKERNALDVKVTDLKASVVGKERDLTDLNTQLTSVKSKNDNLVDRYGFSLGGKDSISILFEHISGRRWLAGPMAINALFLSIVVNSSEYLTALGGCYQRCYEKEDKFREVDFPLLAKLKSHKDASTEDIMNVLRLEGALADAPGMNDLQPDIEQLKLPIHRSEDQVVLGETSLSLMGKASTSSMVPEASVTTTALSTTFASASSIPPISTDDYEIVGVGGQEGAGTDGQAVADGNVAPFPNVDDVELNIPQ
ncbi:hypothetical protein Tco_1251766 [Tanacetum coccineum]